MPIINKDVQLNNGHVLPVLVNDIKGIVTSSERILSALAQAVAILATSSVITIAKGVAKSVVVLVTETYTEIVIALQDGRIARTIRKYVSAAEIYSLAITNAHAALYREKQRKMLIEALEASFEKELLRLAQGNQVIADG